MHSAIKAMIVTTGIACLLSMRAVATKSAVERPSSQSLAASDVQRTYALTVLFEGPWAFYKDVKNQQLVAIAPEVPGHPKASIRAQKPTGDLDFGVYDLMSLPVAGTITAPDPQNIAPVSTTPTQFAQILTTPSTLKRYVVKLPLPDEIVENLVDTAKVDVQYQPLTNEADYTTEILLSYTLSSLTGVSIAGQDNSGKAITPIPLALSNRFIHIRVGSDFINDDCDTHAKVAFKDLTAFFGNPWYVDFPPYDPKCPKPLEQRAMNLTSSAGKRAVKMASRGKESPETIAKLLALHGYLANVVKIDFTRHRLLTEISLITEYSLDASTRAPAQEETRKAFNAAMDVRAYLKGLPDNDELRDQMRRNLAAILTSIYNASGKNCKAPMVWVTIN